ncbi:MAG: hypothetical protein KDD10_21735, partial [Phaeodactylibacter sp.]|nr:hypothetical protein [Phaeodactylibacter sp.]
MRLLMRCLPEKVTAFCLIGFFCWFGKGYGQNCNADFTFSAACNVVTFTPGAQSDTLNYNWSFGDGNTSTAQMPVHTYFEDSAGNYSYEVTLIVNGNCIPDTVTQTVNISIGALPDVVLTTPLISPPFAYCFSRADDPSYTLTVANGSTGNQSYFIDWGDGTPPFSANNPFISTTHTFDDRGIFNILYVVENNSGCQARDTFPFFNGNAPAAGGISTPANSLKCVPTTIDFAFNQQVIEQDAPGTIYTIYVNDGSGDTTQLTNPLNTTTFPYEFTNSPCEFGSTQFTITMVSANACNDLSSTTSISLDREPMADFIIDPEIVCETDTVTVTNESVNGLFVSAGTCSDEMNSFWSVTPGVEGVDYEIISGDLGSPPFPPGSEEGFTVVFNNDGQYDIQLIYGSAFSSSCPPDTLTKSICVVPIPEAAFSLDSYFGCFPHVVEASNESNTLESCDTTLYTWQVFFQGGECDTLGNWSFTDDTDEHSVNPVFEFESPGVYDVILIVDNRCGIDTASRTVTIANAPVSFIDSIPNFCDMAVVTPTIQASSSCNDTIPPSYTWQFPGGNPSAGSGTNPGSVTYINNTGVPQTYTVTLVTNNVCGMTTATRSFIIYPSPEIPDIASNSPICTGNTLEFTLTNADGLTFSWTGPNGFVSDEQDPSIPNATTLNSGEYFLTVTDIVSGCVNDTSVMAVV